MLRLLWFFHANILSHHRNRSLGFGRHRNACHTCCPSYPSDHSTTSCVVIFWSGNTPHGSERLNYLIMTGEWEKKKYMQEPKKQRTKQRNFLVFGPWVRTEKFMSRQQQQKTYSNWMFFFCLDIKHQKYVYTACWSGLVWAEPGELSYELEFPKANTWIVKFYTSIVLFSITIRSITLIGSKI